LTQPLVRPAVPDDAPAIAEVRMSSWEATYGPYLPPDVWGGVDTNADAARFRARLEAGVRYALVAEVDGAVRAFAFYGPCRDDDLPGAGEVMAIYAHPDYVSTGLGRAVLAAAIDALDVRPVVLWVLENNARARRFYEIAGFRTDGARKQAELLGGVQLPEIRYRLD
jgi:RimJ/RimL family protein N-acetyltransferase